MKNIIIGLSVILICAFGLGCFTVGMMYKELLDFRQRDAVMHMAAGLVTDAGESHYTVKHAH